MRIHRGSGVGDHGVTGIQTFLDEHSCGPVCRKLKLGDVTSEEPPHSPQQESEDQMEDNDD